MCDYVPGEALLTFPNDPQLVEILQAWLNDHGDHFHVSLIETIDDRLSSDLIPHRARREPLAQHWRIRVPEGEEHAKADDLVRKVQEIALAGLHAHMNPALILDVHAAPNLRLRTTGNGDPDVTLTPTHAAYKRMAGLDAPRPTGKGVTVAILDTGISANVGYQPERALDFVTTPTVPGAIMPGAPDVFGHGTAVASVIADLVPSANLIVYKVAGNDGSASEWDVIAGLLTVADADVVNLSLQFSHNAVGGRCPCCGHNAGASRSIVFEKAIAALLRGDRPPVVVAAAGNSSANSLAYPARFATCVAVGSLNASRERSSFSNFGATDETLRHHPNLFFLPGGDSTAGHEESVASSANVPLHFWGTSFACAYASGIAAVLRTHLSATATVAHLRATAVPDVVHFTPDDHGNGRMVLA